MKNIEDNKAIEASKARKKDELKRMEDFKAKTAAAKIADARKKKEETIAAAKATKEAAEKAIAAKKKGKGVKYLKYRNKYLKYKSKYLKLKYEFIYNNSLDDHAFNIFYANSNNI